MKGYRRSKRDANHADVVRALKDAGRQVVELDGAKDKEPGIPDVLVAWPGGLVFLEFKVGTNGLEDTQKRWHADYRGPRGSLVVVRSPAEALRATGIAA